MIFCENVVDITFFFFLRIDTTNKPHVKQGLTTLSTHDASICPKVVVIHHHHHMCSCTTNDNFLPHFLIDHDIQNLIIHLRYILWHMKLKHNVDPCTCKASIIIII